MRVSDTSWLGQSQVNINLMTNLMTEFPVPEPPAWELASTIDKIPKNASKIVLEEILYYVKFILFIL